MNKSRGYSLIEFMVAAALGLLVMLGISRVFVAAQVGYGLSQARSTMQDNARFASESIQRDLRMAGYMGCVNDGARLRTSEVFVHLPGGTSSTSFAGVNFADNFSRGIEGFEAAGTAPGNAHTLSAASSGGSWSPALPTTLAGQVSPGSDVLVVRYLGPNRARLTTFTPNASGARVVIETNGLTKVEAGKTYALTDCNQVSFFTASSVGNNGASFVASGVGGTENYSPSTAYLYEATTVAYYVGSEPSGRKGLFRYPISRTSAPPTEALVPGVLTLQALYAWDTHAPLPDGAVDTEGTAQALAAARVNGTEVHQRIGQARVALLMAEDGPRASDTDPNRSRAMLGTTMTPPRTENDRLTMVYDLAGAPRNHLFGY
jgi:type IV pilus assembly protein PilW